MFEPFEYQFFVRGILAATMVGGLCGLIGVYIVLKRMSYIGHGLSHAILGGAVVSFVLSINFLVGATVWGFLCAQLIALTAKKRKIASDAAIGVITTPSFATGGTTRDQGGGGGGGGGGEGKNFAPKGLDLGGEEESENFLWSTKR